MRKATMLVLAAACGLMLAPDAPQKKPTLNTRYRIEVDLLEYPQAKPQEALASVLKAVDAGRYSYLLAHLADPAWVDERVQNVHASQFEPFVDETRAKFANDKSSLNELRRFAEAGSWEVMGDNATAQVKDANERVYMRRLENRWFLENRKQPAAEK